MPGYNRRRSILDPTFRDAQGAINPMIRLLLTGCARGLLVPAHADENQAGSDATDKDACAPPAGGSTAAHRVFELRTYHTNEGKLDRPAQAVPRPHLPSCSRSTAPS